MGNQADPRIEVRAEEDADWVTVSVCDNGRGVTPEDADRIFRVFEKLDPATEGSGVGLAICRRIAEAHGGTLWVESNGPGTGSRFAFTLAKRRESTTEEGMTHEAT